MVESDTSKLPKEELDILENYIQGLFTTVREPLMVLDSSGIFIGANQSFERKFRIPENVNGNTSVFNINENQFETSEFRAALEKLQKDEKPVSEKAIQINIPGKGEKGFTVNASILNGPGKRHLYLFSFKKLKKIETSSRQERVFNRIIDEVLSNAPAAICILRGKNHVFEVANEKYINLIGNRDVIGKTVKEVLPEVSEQGFLELLDGVYNSGKAYVGNEIPLKLNDKEGGYINSYLNFVYEPTRNKKGEVDGIFVHAVDVSPQVEARKVLEDNESRLREVINTVPAIIWITDTQGQSLFLNKNWYTYTGHTPKESEGMGWLDATHPEDRKSAEFAFLEAHNQKKPYTISFRLRNKNGEYRWVLDKASPKFDANGQYEGMIGTVIDVHDEKIKENLVREKEHRMQGIVKEATVATAIYTGLDMNIELANDAMIKLWGKDHSVIGKPLHQALP